MEMWKWFPYSTVNVILRSGDVLIQQIQIRLVTMITWLKMNSGMKTILTRLVGLCTVTELFCWIITTTHLWGSIYVQCTVYMSNIVVHRLHLSKIPQKGQLPTLWFITWRSLANAQIKWDQSFFDHHKSGDACRKSYIPNYANIHCYGNNWEV